jgi:hypothetical protein
MPNAVDPIIATAADPMEIILLSTVGNKSILPPLVRNGNANISTDTRSMEARLPSEDLSFESLSTGMIPVLIGSFDARKSSMIWFSWGQLQSR